MNEQTAGYSTTTRPIPEGFHTVTPFIVVEGANKLLGFIKKAFHGETIYMMTHTDGRIWHARTRIGNSIIMVADAMDTTPSTPCMLYLYVDDIDTVYQKALKAGAQSLREPANEFFGDRAAGVKDEWGNQWWIATHVEDVSEEEMTRRKEELQKQ